MRAQRLFLMLAAILMLSGVTQAATYFTGTLSGTQEVPSTSSTATGFGRVTLNDAETQITVSLTFSGLSSNQVASHIHAPAPVGVNAPVLFNIGSTGMTSGTFSALTFAVTPAQVADMKAGLWYFNVHSTNFPGGEIRGQINVDSPYLSYLSSNQEVPVSGTGATGSGAVSLSADNTRIVATLQFSGLSSNQVASHIHGAAQPGVNAPILFNIGSTGATSGTFTDLFFDVTPAQVAQLKSAQWYFNVHSANFPGGETRGQIQRRTSDVVDYDGDGITDPAVARNNTGANQIEWYIRNSGTGTLSAYTFGVSTDYVTNRIIAGDYDGDGKDDIALWRTGASAAFYIIQSSDFTVRTEVFGQTGDDPRVVEDYDGDGRADVAVYRPTSVSGGQAYWFYRASANNPTGTVTYVPFGSNGQFPNPGDYDGDGRGDFLNQVGGNWYLLKSSNGSVSITPIGTAASFGVPGDYDGDGKTDVAVTQTEGGATAWYYVSSVNPTQSVYNTRRIWGPTTNRVRAQGDYDGDGKTDRAVYINASGSGQFWALRSTNEQPLIQPWGLGTDFPIAGYNNR